MTGSEFSERYQTMDEETNDSVRPKGRIVNCPECETNAVAVIPEDASIVSGESSADGSVWVNCHECGDKFRVYFVSEE
ncbi:hypothetical protein [Halomicrobium urmianum]|uniref:hypothetical protein n=1 Tax=Halomicrobium urmianum TaxID=1586233 RepID=UPI001CD958E2|nr:hypothetical protein [Halomicrobium urmianum]